MKLVLMSVAMAGLLGAMLRTEESQRPRQGAVSSASCLVHPVGWIHKRGSETAIDIEPKFQDALLGLDEFSHVWVLWWFDRNDTPEMRSILQVHPRRDLDNPLTGVFATRSPVRPNLIALTLCRIISISDNIVQIESIDAFEGTPVLDLKPYIPGYDSASGATVPDWLAR